MAYLTSSTSQTLRSIYEYISMNSLTNLLQPRTLNRSLADENTTLFLSDKLTLWWHKVRKKKNLKRLSAEGKKDVREVGSVTEEKEIKECEGITGRCVCSEKQKK